MIVNVYCRKKGKRFLIGAKNYKICFFIFLSARRVSLWLQFYAASLENKLPEILQLTVSCKRCRNCSQDLFSRTFATTCLEVICFLFRVNELDKYMNLWKPCVAIETELTWNCVMIINFTHLEKLNLNLTSSSFVIRANLLHP